MEPLEDAYSLAVEIISSGVKPVMLDVNSGV
jgi:hypothetical protein